MNKNSIIQYSTEDSMQNKQHQILQQSKKEGNYQVVGHLKPGHHPEKL
jgi:hypothetical protein